MSQSSTPCGRTDGRVNDGRASSPRAHDVDDDDDGVRRPDAVKRQRLLDLPDMRRGEAHNRAHVVPRHGGA
jgi:hypothetical protein